MRFTSLKSLPCRSGVRRALRSPVASKATAQLTGRLGRQAAHQLPATERPVLQLLRPAGPVQRRGRAECTFRRGRCRRTSATPTSTYQPFMPHEYMYKHERSYYTYNPGAGWRRTNVRYGTCCLPLRRHLRRHALPDEQQHLGAAQRLLLPRRAVLEGRESRVESREPEINPPNLAVPRRHRLRFSSHGDYHVSTSFPADPRRRR